MSCPYKDSLGKIGEGAHSYRIFDIAVVDVLFTIIAAVIIHALFPQYKFALILVSIFAAGIVAHRVLCVRTTIDKILF